MSHHLRYVTLQLIGLLTNSHQRIRTRRRWLKLREALEDIRTKIVPRAVVPRTVREEISLLRGIIAGNVEHIDPWDLSDLDSEKASEEHQRWAKELYKKWEEMSASKAKADKELTGKDLVERELGGQVIDPIGDEPSGGYSDEPPF